MVAAQAAAAASPVWPEVLIPESVNDVGLTTPLKTGDKGSAVLRAQILLDRARFSPGEIDAVYGSNLHRAIAGFQASHGLEVSGNMDAPTWAALDSGSMPAPISVTLSAEDVVGPFRPLPSGMPAQAKLDALGYVSSLGALGERFHASPMLLSQLNPGRDLAAPANSWWCRLYRPARRCRRWRKSWSTSPTPPCRCWMRPARCWRSTWHPPAANTICCRSATGRSRAWASTPPSTSRLSCSWGCQALRSTVAKSIIDVIKDGQFEFSYYPDQAWLDRSALLHCAASHTAQRDTDGSPDAF